MSRHSRVNGEPMLSVAKPVQRKWTPFAPWLLAAVTLAVFAVLAATLLWHFAAQKSEAIIDAWIAREKAVGRVWTCPQRTVEGYPFTIEIACAKPCFDGIIF